jgi:5'(3')-deoxyribonucleotidase
MGGERSKTIYQMIQNAMGVKVAMNNEKLYTEQMKEKPVVYIDMDGVLADFFGGVEKLYGVQHWKDLSKDNKLDLKQEVINRITGTDFFATLPEFPTADQLITMVKKFTGGTFSILTSPLRGDHEISSKYKKLWIGQHIENPEQTIITGRKESYAKNKASGTPNILIDDRPVNIERWQGAGGYGILYQANRDSLTKVQTALDQYGKV